MKKLLITLAFLCSLFSLDVEGQLFFKNQCVDFNRVPIWMVDSVDGQTAELDCEAAGGDCNGLVCQGSKNGGTWTDLENCDAADECVQTGDGQYYVALTAEECNTPGFLGIRCTASGAKEWRDYHMVIDDLPADVVQLAGVTSAATGLGGLGDGISVSTVNGDLATTTIFDTGLTITNADFYNDATLLFTSGALDGQSRRITDYGDDTVVHIATVSGNIGSSTTPSLASVVVGTEQNRALICSIQGRNGSLTAVTSGDFNTAESMTLIDRVAQAANLWSETWILYNPTATTAAVDFVIDNADATAISCSTYSGVKQITGTGTVVENQGTTGTSDSLSPTGTLGLAYDAIVVENTATTLAGDGGGQIERSNLTDAASYDAGTSDDTNATIGWTWTGSVDFVHNAFIILPAKIITVDFAFSVAPSDTDSFVIIQHGFGAIRPTTPARTLDVAATGEAGLDFDNTIGTIAKTTDITGFNDLTAAAVNAEVVDVLFVDTIPELTGPPSGVPTFSEAMATAHVINRNKTIVTRIDDENAKTEYTNDAGTVIIKQTDTDDGGDITTLNEMESP